MVNWNILFYLILDEIVKLRKFGYKLLDLCFLEKVWEVWLKEIKMWGIVWEILFYLFFLWILMVISYRNCSYMFYYYKVSFEKVFIMINDIKYYFLKVRNLLKDCICINKCMEINVFYFLLNYNF